MSFSIWLRSSSMVAMSCGNLRTSMLGGYSEIVNRRDETVLRIRYGGSRGSGGSDRLAPVNPWLLRSASEGGPYNGGSKSERDARDCCGGSSVLKCSHGAPLQARDFR